MEIAPRKLGTCVILSFEHSSGYFVVVVFFSVFSTSMDFFSRSGQLCVDQLYRRKIFTPKFVKTAFPHSQITDSFFFAFNPFSRCHKLGNRIFEIPLFFADETIFGIFLFFLRCRDKKKTRGS